ncbi:MAG: YitT family protein [Oscillospiraceae bacterium]|nr:YitT family protein [Oscillospiraceae bacterium]
MNRFKKILTYLVIVGIGFVGALNYELFVFPNQFAPSGVNGICTIIQHVFGISVGSLSLLINVPLAALCYFKCSKPIALRSMVYVVTFSLGLIILDHVDLSMFAYSTPNGTSKILGPLVAGVIHGFDCSILARASAYSGGMDFISALIHEKDPNKSVYGLTFIMNVIIAITSYFVFGYQMEPVILCILYSFSASTLVERRMKSGREAVRFEIITDYPREISDEIIRKVRHTTTLIPAKGMYAGRETNLLICVVNKTQVSQVARIIRKYPYTFSIIDPVSEVMGNFKSLNTDGTLVRDVLDHGDGKTL